MRKLNLVPFLITIILLLNGCGFKIVNKSDQANFNIQNISTSGEKRINYKIRNKLLFYSNSSQKNLINLVLDTVKDKNIKEKNINNKVTKYEVRINVAVTLIDTSDLNTIKFKISKSGEFSVASQHSQTLNNEKKLIDLLADEISNNIFDEITSKYNAI